MDRVRKLNISESYTPSSESYSNYFISWYLLFSISRKKERERGRVTSEVKLIKMSSEDGNKNSIYFELSSQALITEVMILCGTNLLTTYGTVFLWFFYSADSIYII
jgi:hypothetical protein